MPYGYVTSAGLSSKPSPQWIDVDLSNVPVYKIFADYQQVILTLMQGDEQVYVDMNQLRSRFSSYNNTLTVLLVSLGDEALVHMAELPCKKFKYATYTDAMRVGYHTNLTKAGVVVPAEYPRSELVDLELTRPDYATDMSLIHDYCLASVNGFYHQTDTDGEKAYVIQGGKSVQKKNMGHVGLMNFMGIGKLAKKAIDLSTVVPSMTNGALVNGLKFSVDMDLTDKSYFLVLGGYLVLPNELQFFQTGDKTFQLNLNAMPYLERILESDNFIDLSPLGLTQSEINPENVNLEELNSDAVVLRYLGLSQSFMVVVDRPGLFWTKRYLKQAQMPGLFTAYYEPTSPLVVGHGRTAEYWKVYEDGRWAMTVVDSWFRNYIFNRQGKDELVNVTQQLAMDRPFFYSQGFLLEIGAPIPVSVN